MSNITEGPEITEHERWIETYKQGHSIRTIAEGSQSSYGRVHDVIEASDDPVVQERFAALQRDAGIGVREANRTGGRSPVEELVWPLKLGERISRKELQDEVGGRTQGGIGPSKKTPNVLIFTDAASGEQHGYIDGWQPDGCFHYTGEGQRGDQRMMSGNRSILDHVVEQRSLRLFNGARGEVEYIGEFELDSDQPWYETDAPETGGGPVRKVIVFRLRPLDTAAPASSGSRFAPFIEGERFKRVPIEANVTEKTYVDPNREPYEAERRESALVQKLATYLRGRGHDVCRLQFLPPGEFKPLFADLFDETTDVLVEAKGSVTRESIRMAIGQLIDYSRFTPSSSSRKVILVPTRPREDLVNLVQSQHIELIWTTPAGFTATDADLLD